MRTLLQNSESITEMNHPAVRILTIRRYAWTFLPRPVSGGPKLLVPSPQGIYSISVHTKLSCNISMTYISFNHASGTPSVSFNLGMAYQRRFSKLSWFSVLQASTLCLYMFIRQMSLRFDCCPKKKVETKTLAEQTNYTCNSCTDQHKCPGWIHNLPV